MTGGIYPRSFKPAKKEFKFMDDVDKVLAKTVAKVEKTLESEVRLLVSNMSCFTCSLPGTWQCRQWHVQLMLLAAV